MRKFWLWLMRHGIELQARDSGYTIHTSELIVAVNHRYLHLEVGFAFRPSIGVYTDELNTPHAEIAATYESEDKL